MHPYTHGEKITIGDNLITSNVTGHYITCYDTFVETKNVQFALSQCKFS